MPQIAVSACQKENRLPIESFDAALGLLAFYDAENVKDFGSLWPQGGPAAVFRVSELTISAGFPVPPQG